MKVCLIYALSLEPFAHLSAGPRLGQILPPESLTPSLENLCVGIASLALIQA